MDVSAMSEPSGFWRRWALVGSGDNRDAWSASRELRVVQGMEGRRHVGWNSMGPPVIVTLFVFKIAESFVKEYRIRNKMTMLAVSIIS
jgi:hypothetical protein